MAKNEKLKDDENAGEEAGSEGAGAQSGKGLAKLLGALKKKKILVIGAGVLLLVICAAAVSAFLFFKPGSKSAIATAQEVPLTPPKVAFSDMQDILVNIQSNDGTPTYLKLGLSLELDDDAEKLAIQPLMPRITDQFQAYLRELRIDDLKGSEGVLRLKEELLRRVNVAAAPYHVRDVLLKEMIIQ